MQTQAHNKERKKKTENETQTDNTIKIKQTRQPLQVSLQQQRQNTRYEPPCVVCLCVQSSCRHNGMGNHGNHISSVDRVVVQELNKQT